MSGNFFLRIGSLWSKNRCCSHILVWLCISLCLSDHFINHPLLSHIHILCSFWTMKWNAYIFTNAGYQCKWGKGAYHQSPVAMSPHLCTLIGNKHLFISRKENAFGSPSRKAWWSFPNFIVLDGTSCRLYIHCSGTIVKHGFFSLSQMWLLSLKYFNLREVSNLSWSQNTLSQLASVRMWLKGLMSKLLNAG